MYSEQIQSVHSVQNLPALRMLEMNFNGTLIHSQEFFSTKIEYCVHEHAFMVLYFNSCICSLHVFVCYSFAY